jgi:hypothetical protein
MTRDEIITAMRAANRDGRWPLLCERLRRTDGSEIFHALFPIAAEAQEHAPAYDAACLLFDVKPTCPIPCKDAIRAMLPHWDISIQELPWYLAGYFGEGAIRQALKELRGDLLSQQERVRLDTVRYWVEIFFTLAPQEVREGSTDE